MTDDRPDRPRAAGRSGAPGGAAAGQERRATAVVGTLPSSAVAVRR